MSIVQTTYPDFHDAFVDGQIANANTRDIDSWTNQGTNDIPFGRAVSRSNETGAGDRDVERYDGARYVGIAIMDERAPAASNGAYRKGDIVSVAWRGDIAVKVSAAVNAGDDVVIATAATGSGNTAEEIGQLSTKTADSTHIALPGAKFIRKAAAQGISVVRLAGRAEE